MTVNFSNNPYKDFIKMAGTQQPVSSTVKKPVNDVLKEDKAEIALVKVGDAVSEEKDSKSSRKKIFGIIGISVGSVALLTLIGLSLLSKGFSSGLAKKFQKYSDKIRDSIFEMGTESKKLTLSQKLKLRVIKTVQPVVDAMQAASNFTAVKDSVLHNWMKKWGIGSWVDKLNKPFKKVVLTTKNKAYNESELAMVEFCNLLKKTKNPELQKYAQDIQNEYAKQFSSSSHIGRADAAWEKMKNLHEEVYGALFPKNGEKTGFFKNLKRFRSYITTDKIAKDRELVIKELEASKQQISNGISDVYNSMKKGLFGIKNSVDHNNKEAVAIVKQLSENLEKYKTLGKALGADAEKVAREKLTGEIKSNLTSLLTVSRKDIKNSEKLKVAEAQIEKMFEALSDKALERGAAQKAVSEIKALYGKYSPEYAQAVSQLEKMNKKLNGAINSEIAAYEKLAELRVGSVPTDILGILGPSALAVGMVVNSKDKDERVSKALTKGVPILGGIGMSYYGTTRGFTGAKNLVLGLATGFILNLVGSTADSAYKKYSAKQNILLMAYNSMNKLQAKLTPEVKVDKVDGAALTK